MAPQKSKNHKLTKPYDFEDNVFWKPWSCSVGYVLWYLKHGWWPGDQFWGISIQFICLWIERYATAVEIIHVVTLLLDWPYNHRGTAWVKEHEGGDLLETLTSVDLYMFDDQTKGNLLRVILRLLEHGATPPSNSPDVFGEYNRYSDSDSDSDSDRYSDRYSDIGSDDSYECYGHWDHVLEYYNDDKQSKLRQQQRWVQAMKVLMELVVQIPNISADTAFSSDALVSLMSNEDVFWYLFDMVLKRNSNVDQFLQTCLDVRHSVSGTHVDQILVVVAHTLHQRILKAMSGVLGATVSNSIFKVVVSYM